MKSGIRQFVCSLVACLCGVLAGGALDAQVSITSGTPPNGAIGTPYSFTFTGQNSCGSCSESSFQYSASGVLPNGLLFDNATGVLSGTPTTVGNFNNVSITATDTANDDEQSSQTYTIVISSPAETFYVLNPGVAINIVAINGGTTVTCPKQSEGDPCFNYVFASDFSVDGSGNFIVAMGNAIARLNPTNPPNPTNVVPLAAAGDFSEDAYFNSVALDAGGNYIVADSGNHTMWFFPAAGGAGTRVGSYAGTCDDSCEDVYVRLDASGNYIVAQDGDGGLGEIQLYKFTPCTTSGVCPPFQNQSGEGSGIMASTLAGQVFGLTFDGTGRGANYVITVSSEEGSYVATVTPGGVLSTLFDNDNEAFCEALGIFHDPQTSNFLITSDNEALYALSSDGTGIGTIFSSETLSNPVAVLVKLQAPPAITPAGPPPPPPLVLTGVALPGAFAYEAYSASVSASGGVPAYSYTATGGPAGITVAPWGAISGITTATGNFSLIITVTDGQGLLATATFTLAVSSPPAVTVQGGTLTSTIVETPGSLTLSATGGAPPYTWALLVGSPPSGMTLQSSGTLNGVPLKTGTFNFAVRATDTFGGSAVGSYSMTILPPPLTVVTPSPLATGMVNVGYPLQTISASGGVPPYQFTTTTGVLPPGLTLASDGAITGTPTATGTSFTVTASDSAVPASIGTANLSITVRPFAPDLALSSGSVSFALAAGTTVLPPSQTVQVEATEVTQVIGYSVAVSPATATWLSVSSAGGNTPGSFSISLTSAALSLAASATPYQASVVVTCTAGPCNGNTQTVGVTLTVSIVPQQLTVLNSLLAFNTLATAPQSTTQTLGVQNSGGGTIGVSSITCGTTWCQLSGVPGTIGAGATAAISVAANPAGLSAGYYWTDVSIVTSAGSAIVPVTFLIASNGTLTLAPAGAQFALPQGGDAVGETSFLVSISGSASVTFSAQVTPGAPWLSVTPTSGTTSGTQPAGLNLVFNQTAVAALTAGTYYATVQIASTGAVNSPQSFEVVLNVTAAPQQTTPDPVPGGLIYLTQATSTPPAQTVTVYSSAPAATGYQASAATNSGGNWLSVSPTTGTTSGAAEAQSSVSANPSGLNPGVYTGTVSYAFSTTAVRSVNVTLVVENVSSTPPTTGLSSPGAHAAAAAACTPTQIVPTSTALVSNFAAPAAWPIDLAVTLVDDCGSPIGNGQVVATFSNGDPPLALNLANAPEGLYDGTWTPQHTQAEVSINAGATAPGLAAASLQIAGAVTPNDAPILANNSIANSYDPVGGAPLAPGTLVQIAGQYLAGQTLTSTAIPLPVTLGGTLVIIGGIQAPISSVSPGQISAQVPFELPPGQPYQVIVSANGALTTPDSFQAGSVSPGLSVLPSGYVQANHQSSAAVTESAPAAPGEYISVYLVGMGSTTVPVSSGAPGPSSPFADTVTAPTITLNNETTSFNFSGLIPGAVGVYQVNLQIPTDAPNGNLILSFSESGVNSNSGILPVHH